MKQKHEFENIVAETLLIPLYMRAKENRRKNPILCDKLAEQLVENIEYDYSRFDGAKLSEVGCVIRGWYFDHAIRRFIDTHTRPVVVMWVADSIPVISVSEMMERPYFMSWIYRRLLLYVVG